MGKRMGKRLIAGLTGLALMLLMGGCWNYRSLDEMGIVLGIAIDFDQEKNEFSISYEAADLAGAFKQESVAGSLIRAQGKTLFDTARNAKRKEQDRLFFGTAHVLVISEQLAREVGILSVSEWFLRDAECRETMHVAISQAENAEKILQNPEGEKGLMSMTIYSLLHKDKDVTGTSHHMPLYQIYNALHSPRGSAAIPALRRTMNGDQEVTEINGAAIIKEDKLVGFLPPELSRYLLIAENQLKSGVLTLSTTAMAGDDLSLEIFKNDADKSYTYAQDKITMRIETRTDVAVGENRADLDLEDRQVISWIEEKAARKIEEGIRRLIDTLQDEMNADVLGFGEMIYKRDLPLWRQLSPQWDEIYPTVEVEVSSTVRIVNTASTK